MPRRSRSVVVAVVFATALVLPGCAQGPGPLRRHPGVESTLGTDPATVPPGTVYGPSGLGVDLVHRESTGLAAPSLRAAVFPMGPTSAPARS